MFDLSAIRVPGFDPAAGTLALPPLPLWTVGAGAIIAILFCLFAFARATRSDLVGSLARVALLLVGAGVAWFILDGSAGHDLKTERQALDVRAAELMARALVPGSALACLEAAAGDAVAVACEKALFATPEATAIAVSYVAAQVLLLADGADYARRGGRGYEAVLTNLRQAAELDRFGIVAHVLAARDGCLPEQCQAFALLRDASRVRRNLNEGTYDLYVMRHAPAWPNSPSPPVTAMAPAVGSSDAPTAVSAPGSAPTLVKPPGPNVFFPSAASIPPVNIMNAEPAAPEPAAEPAAATIPTPPRKPPAPVTQAAPSAQSSQHARRPAEPANPTARPGSVAASAAP
jgi:hypothetical protein